MSHPKNSAIPAHTPAIILSFDLHSFLFMMKKSCFLIWLPKVEKNIIAGKRSNPQIIRIFATVFCTFYLNRMQDRKKAVLIILTGGTICMAEDSQTGALRPIDSLRLKDLLPELTTMGLRVDTIPFDPLIDSSDVHPPVWSQLSHIIYDNYDMYDGFVILHGTDTMAYTASALSFMLERSKF